MELDAVLSAISTVGFPIVCCVAMFWLMYHNQKQHTEEVKTMTETINNNTIALTKLVEQIEQLEALILNDRKSR